MEREYDQKVSVVISKAFFEQHKEAAAKRYAREFEGDKDPEGFYFTFETQTQEMDIEKNTLSMDLMDRQGSWLSFKWKVNNDMYAYLAEVCIKKLNKLRALLEAAS